MAKNDKFKEEVKEVLEEIKAPIKYFHVDEFLSKRAEKLSQEIVNGFKVFLKGRLYQLSLEDFEKELENFFNRKI